MIVNWGMLGCGITLFSVCYVRQYEEDSFLEHLFTTLGMICSILLIYFSKGEIWQ